MIPRYLTKRIKDRLHNSEKVQIIYGARQVGKTTLIKEILKEFEGKVLRINADTAILPAALSSRNLDELRGLVQGYDLLFIDEAQRIPNIGINLKILHDHFPRLRIIVTGSSSLDLANRLKEPLTGRTWTYQLFPISMGEWKSFSGANDFEMRAKLDEWLRFGLYPETLAFKNYSDKQEYLNELSNAYLYKDILNLANLQYPEKIAQLLRLLAVQVGDLISIQELAEALQIHRDTINNYLNLLEKTFVIFRLSGFSRQLTKEITKMEKIFFYDIGIRNAILGNFSELRFRQDTDRLWENFLLAERKKRNHYQRIFANTFFWKTYSGSALNYLEEYEGKLSGFEFSWKKEKGSPSPTWLETYSNGTYTFINPKNFLDFAM